MHSRGAGRKAWCLRIEPHTLACLSIQNKHNQPTDPQSTNFSLARVNELRAFTLKVRHAPNSNTS